jgi:hypothetical protein
MANYPSGPATFPARSDGQTIFAQHVQLLQDEIAAIEAGLLTTGFQHPLWGAQAFTMTGILTTPQITANQNDYAPAGLAQAFILRLSADAARSITGILAQPSGRLLCITAASSFAITLVHNSAASAVPNRFLNPGLVDLVLAPGATAWFFYDTATSFWRCISTATPAPAAVSNWPIAGKIVNTAAQALTTNTFTALTFNNYDFQNGGAAWVVGTPTRITIPAGTGANGIYAFFGTVQTPSASNIWLRFLKNGAACACDVKTGVASPAACGLHIATTVLMQPGDFMELWCNLPQGGSVGGATRELMTEFSYAKQNPT